MALEIFEKNGEYQIRGKLNSQNIGALKIYFQSILETNEDLIIDLEQLEYFDVSVAYYLEKLHKMAALQNKSIKVKGVINANVKQVLDTTNTLHLLMNR